MFNEQSRHNDDTESTLNAKDVISKAKRIIRSLKRYFKVGSTTKISAGVAGKISGRSLGVMGAALDVDMADAGAKYIVRLKVDKALRQDLISYGEHNRLVNSIGTNRPEVISTLRKIKARREEAFND